MRHGRTPAVAMAAVFLGLIAAWLSWRHVQPLPAAVSAGTAREWMSAPTGAPQGGAGPTLAAVLAPRDGTAAEVAAVDELWRTGSLRGSDLDGDWGRWVGGSLQPSSGLRRRFDQLLSAQGEVPLDALRPWIAAHVRAQHPDIDNAAQQVLDVWDRYLQLQQAPFTQRVDVADASTWQPALAEHSRVRRRLLGDAWAEAFYGDEERSVAAFAGERQAAERGDRPAALATSTDTVDRGLLQPSSDTPVARLQAARESQFGVDAAARLQANDAAWAQWNQRIAAAKVEWATLAAAPELSAVQRQEAQQRLLHEQFSEEELPRAAALVPTAP